MLRDGKWLSYAIRILGAINKGADSIAYVALTVKGSESYIAKVIASLRRGGLITSDYKIIKPLSELPVACVLALMNDDKENDAITQYVINHMVTSLSITVGQVLQDNETTSPSV